jgi:hypothetical protein
MAGIPPIGISARRCPDSLLGPFAVIHAPPRSGGPITAMSRLTGIAPPSKTCARPLSAPDASWTVIR